jgi:hypothetical protein
LVNVDIRAPLHVEAITGVILAGRRGSRMGGADKGLQNFNGVSSVWLKPWRAKTPTLLWLPHPKKKVYEADAILDRLVHSAYKINLRGESMRKRKAKLTSTPGSE